MGRVDKTDTHRESILYYSQIDQNHKARLVKFREAIQVDKGTQEYKKLNRSNGHTVKRVFEERNV